MPTAIASRLFTILAITYLGLSTIFPAVPGSLFFFFNPKQEISFKPALKPGIDMVGGASLVYEIKPTEGGVPDANLAEKVATALKRRVDPDGLKNLVWRPSGSSRLEIQMPLSAASLSAKPLRDAFAAAKSALVDTNVSSAQVLAAMSDTDPINRQKRLDALVLGSNDRQRLFSDLLANQAGAAAAAAEDAVTRGQARIEREALLVQVNRLNINVDSFAESLVLRDPIRRKDRIDQFKQTSGDYPTRLAAIDAVVKAYDAYAPLQEKVDDTTSLKTLLRGSGVLSFHIVAKLGDVSQDNFIQYQQRLATDGPRFRSGDELRWFQIPAERVEDIVGSVDSASPAVGLYNGEYYLLVWNTSEKSMVNRPGLPQWGLASSYVTQGGTLGGESVVGFDFDAIGARYFGDLTGSHTPSSPGGPFTLAPVLDGKVISAPNIQSQIFGRGTISGGRGGFKPAELAYLVNTLSAGSLPAQLKDEPMVERTVGPQLGADNLRRGLIACGFGVVVVAIFLIGYYFLSGVVAMVAVTLNLVLILAGMAAFETTFTLAGVAGIILTIGMAVDANVLIFERLREEQLKGLSIRLALRNAYDRAFSAIFDSNLTTAITAAVLVLIGTEEVRGFGITLLLGLVSSMFTALYVTKTIFALLIDKFGITRLSSLPLAIPAWDKLLKPNIDWMGKVWYFIVFSSVFIVVGLSLFVYKFSQGKVLDIEFAGGTTVQFELKEPMRLEDVRTLINNTHDAKPDVLPAVGVQSVGDDSKTYEVVTVNSKALEVRRAVEETFSGKLNVAEPIRFDGVRDLYEEAVRKQILVPIESDSQSIAGLIPANIVQHVGGVAVILKDLSSTTVNARQIEERMEQQRQQMGGSFKNIDVEALPDNVGFVVLMSSDDVKYDAGSPASWEDMVARPTWTKVVDGLNSPANLQRVNTIDPSVASDTRIDAIMATIIAVVAIVGYIWARFGDVKFGSATVIATVHDTLIVLAAIGFAHLISETFIGQLFYIDAFRLNLTLIAAILTVIGYSMNDTVVVFDRVRENRGKLGHVDRNIINDSVNQTLSRTLLTGGTTLVTVMFMYVAGGEAIHGFTYVLIVGIIVGTYSSIAIASPLLLLGSPREKR